MNIMETLKKYWWAVAAVVVYMMMGKKKGKTGTRRRRSAGRRMKQMRYRIAKMSKALTYARARHSGRRY